MQIFYVNFLQISNLCKLSARQLFADFVLKTQKKWKSECVYHKLNCPSNLIILILINIFQHHKEFIAKNINMLFKYYNKCECET